MDLIKRVLVLTAVSEAATGVALYFNWMFLSAVDFLLRLWHGARKLILKGAGEQAGDRTEENP